MNEEVRKKSEVTLSLDDAENIGIAMRKAYIELKLLAGVTGRYKNTCESLEKALLVLKNSC